MTLRSSRDSRGEKFLRACRIQDKEKAVEVLDALYEESIHVVRYRGAFNACGAAHVAARFNATGVLDWLLEHDADFAVLTHQRSRTARILQVCNSFA